jgi:hypothetical protein
LVVTTLRISDLDDRGSLALDLRDLLQLLSPASLEATWTVTSADEPFEATGEGGWQLEKLAKQDAQISGVELSALAKGTAQVIWGEFIGVLANAPRSRWVTISAVDSSFYEVITSDEGVVDKVQASFRNVEITADDEAH